MDKRYTCIIVDDEAQAIHLLKTDLALLYSNITVIGTYTEWEEALEAIRTQPCDILFLDIALRDKNSMDLLKLAPNIQSEIIFITAFSDYAIEAFKRAASGYIMKPIDKEDLVTAVDKALERLKNKKIAQHVHLNDLISVQTKIGIPNNNSIDYVNIHDIIYLQAEKSYTNIVTKGRSIISSYNMQKFKEVLESNIFMQVHRSFVVNLNHICSYKNTGIVVMSNKAEIPVSKNFREDFLNSFNRVHGDKI